MKNSVIEEQDKKVRLHDINLHAPPFLLYLFTRHKKQKGKKRMV